MIKNETVFEIVRRCDLTGESIAEIVRLAMQPNIKSPDEILRGLKAKPSRAIQRKAQV